MAYPNFSSAYAAGFPYAIILSGTGVVQADLSLLSTAKQNYAVVLAAPGDTVQLTATLLDCYGNAATIDDSATITYTSKGGTANHGPNFSQAQIALYNAGTQQNSIGGTPVLGESWNPAGASTFTQDLVDVSSSGLVTGNALCQGVDIEVAYPLSTDGLGNIQKLYALLTVSVLNG
jgi:hypothetical protein